MYHRYQYTIIESSCRRLRLRLVVPLITDYLHLLPKSVQKGLHQLAHAPKQMT
jgi:hypothetical protein